jgi:hypothetical protein
MACTGVIFRLIALFATRCVVRKQPDKPLRSDDHRINPEPPNEHGTGAFHFYQR